MYNMAVSRLLLYPDWAQQVKHTSFPLEQLVSSKVSGILQLIGPSRCSVESNPGRTGFRWPGAAPGAAGEIFLNHGLKKIEGSEGAILDKNAPFLRCFGPVAKSEIRKKRARGGGWPRGGSASRWSLAQLGRKPEYTKLVCLTWWARAFVFPCSETNEKVP